MRGGVDIITSSQLDNDAYDKVWNFDDKWENK
mgnify:FL=1